MTDNQNPPQQTTEEAPLVLGHSDGNCPVPECDAISPDYCQLRRCRWDVVDPKGSGVSAEGRSSVASDQTTDHNWIYLGSEAQRCVRCGKPASELASINSQMFMPCEGPPSQSQTTLPVLPGKQIEPLSRDIIKEIAMDIGKEVASHIETMYPEAVTATSSTFLLSVRNCVHDEIMGMLDVIDEDAIRQRLEERRSHRRRHRAVWRKLRDKPVTEDVIQDA